MNKKVEKMNTQNQPEFNFSGQPNTIGTRTVIDKKGNEVTVVSMQTIATRRATFEDLGYDDEFKDNVYLDRASGKRYVFHDELFRSKMAKNESENNPTQVILVEPTPKTISQKTSDETAPITAPEIEVPAEEELPKGFKKVNGRMVFDQGLMD